jgi:Trk K+ transport system NAD-binding subunit
MVRREVLGTIPVGRSVLLIAEVPVREGSALVGLTASEIDSSGDARLIAIQRAGADVDLQVAPDYALTSGDELIVLATRAGLGAVLARSVGRAAAQGG